VSDADLRKVERFVRNQIERKHGVPVDPTELIEAAKRASLSPGAVRWMLWNLNARGLLEFTDDYRIVGAGVPA
jgi:hypothetical protein